MGHLLGTTEHMILLAIVRLGHEAYGVSIIETLQDATGRAPSSGSLSTSLDRMEAKGLVVSRYVSGGHKRGGHPRRVVQLTASGEVALRRTAAALQRLGEDPTGATP